MDNIACQRILGFTGTDGDPGAKGAPGVPGISGTDGDAGVVGATGMRGVSGPKRSVKSTTVVYQYGMSETIPPTGKWASAPAGEGNYIWARTVTVYSDLSVETSYTVVARAQPIGTSCPKGEPGVAAPSGRKNCRGIRFEWNGNRLLINPEGSDINIVITDSTDNG